jgi:predicted RNA methylase
MSVLDKEFVTTVNNWAVIFEKVMPDDVRTMWSTQDRIIAVLETTLLNTDSSIAVLEAVLEKYREDVVK